MRKEIKMQSDIKRLNLKAGMVDSHFHLHHMINRGLKGFDIIEHCFAEGLEYAVDIGINAENFAYRIETASRYPGLYTAHGFYPSQCVSDNIDAALEYLAECLKKDPKAVALGEIGLDFFHDYGSEDLQADLLKKQLILADELDLPVIIHSRDAEELTVEILSEYSPKRRGIIHCFSYGSETAAKLASMGYYISFAGNMTYKKAPGLREALTAVPPEKLLLETDAPYLSPEGVRHKLNHPGYIGYTYEKAAEQLGMGLDDLIDRVRKNFLDVFAINHRE